MPKTNMTREPGPMARYETATADGGWLTAWGWDCLAGDLREAGNAYTGARQDAYHDRADDCSRRAESLRAHPKVRRSLIMAAPVDPAYWTTAPAFGAAGGPLVRQLTDAGRAVAWSVGAQVRRGPAADAFAALVAAGGKVALLVRTEGTARLELTDTGRRFDQVAWGHLRALGYVDTVRDLDAGTESIEITAKGRAASERGYEEIARLLSRVCAAHPFT